MTGAGVPRDYVFEGYKDGKVVKTLIAGPVSEKKLRTEADHTELKEEILMMWPKSASECWMRTEGYFRISNDPITLTADGPVEIIGPSIVGMSGGMGGTYVKTTGKKGQAKLINRNNRRGKRKR